jgi:predicted TIM-barrel fold metal-dependent hydrolase
MNAASTPYTIISADTHAGANHETYREYLDSAYHDDFDAWRGQYKNPWKDLRDTDLRVRNWDDDRRDRDQLADGVVGEVIFPNTVPPFYPGFVLFAQPPKPDEYEHRRAGIHAHNRWLVDFCGRKPHQRAGIGQFFLNDIDDAIADVTWIKANGLRGGALLPTVAPDVTWVKPLYDPDYDRLWAVMQDLEIPCHLHGGTGSPNYGRVAAAPLLMISEVGFYGMRPFVHMLLSGVFERFPRLRFVITESSVSATVAQVKQLDPVIEMVGKGAVGELRYAAGDGLQRSATEYFRNSVWNGSSFPAPADRDARSYMPADRYMWGSDYPHDEGTGPFTREHLRQIFHATPEAEMRDILAGNAAKLYDFDLDKLAALAAKWGPTVEEIATPLDKLPDGANRALLKGVA